MLACVHRDPTRPRSIPLVSVVVALLILGFALREQGQDPMRHQRALEYYQDSGLARLEMPRYREFLSARTDAEGEVRLAQLGSASPVRAAELLTTDPRFEREVRAGIVLAPESPDYAHWKEARERFGELLAETSSARWALTRAQAAQPWRWFTYALLQAGLGAAALLAVAVLLVAPLAEGALGSWRFALAVLAATATAGAAGLVLSASAVTGAAPLLAGTAAMVLALHANRKVAVSWWPFTAAPRRMTALLAWLPWCASIALLWWIGDDALPRSASAGMQAVGFAAGALAALALRPAKAPALAPGTMRGTMPGTLSHPRTLGAPGTMGGTLGGGTGAIAREAHEAAARLDTRRAAALYRQLVEAEPKRIEYLGAYLNVALLSADEGVLQDAALRILWAKVRAHSDELRRIYLQLTQPKVLAALPFDEHLRLSRRLVRQREDAAALRVLDGLLQDDHLRELYGRQLADCLLGLFTAYTRHGLHRQAEQVSGRLLRYFEAPGQLGGVAPSHRPPTTMHTGLQTTRARLTLVPSPGADPGPASQAKRAR
jgi:membrane associated rhomboid family serine protease